MIVKNYLLFSLICCLVFSGLSAAVPAGAQALKIRNGPEPVNLEGTYQLGVPTVPFKLRQNTLVISLCSTHTFKIVRASEGNIISVRLDSALIDPTKKLLCEISTDSAYIKLIQAVTSYQVVGSTLYLLSQKKIVAKATKIIGYWPATDKLEGKWNLNLLKVPLTATATSLSFSGCNTNNFSYTATDDGKIAVTGGFSTKIACTIDMDPVYTQALLRSRNFTFRPLEFTLYREDGEEVAYGGPIE